jgi:hypothetical protein
MPLLGSGWVAGAHAVQIWAYSEIYLCLRAMANACGNSQIASGTSL